MTVRPAGANRNGTCGSHAETCGRGSGGAEVVSRDCSNEGGRITGTGNACTGIVRADNTRTGTAHIGNPSASNAHISIPHIGNAPIRSTAAGRADTSADVVGGGA